MKRIVVFADSLSLPRVVDEDIVKWEETWPYLLEKKLTSNGGNVEVINCGARARKVDSLIGHDFLEHIVFKEPDVIILQVGIVDAVPRIISLNERNLLSHRFFPKFISKQIISSRKKRKKLITTKKPLAKVYTSPERFKDVLGKFGRKLEKEYHKPLNKVIVLPIVANIPYMEINSPKYGENLFIYNRLLADYSKQNNASLVRIPANFCKDSSNFCSDGYHLSYRGNLKISSFIAQII